MTTCSSCAAVLEQDAAFCGLCGQRVRARRVTLTNTMLGERYWIEAKIAEGGFGAIYRAIASPGFVGTRSDARRREEALDADGHEVALKILHADLASDPYLSARFRREGRTLSSLRDPHTVATYDVGEAEDGTLYIAMELLHGESLLDRFHARGPLPWKTVLEIMRAVCSSLAEAHALGIIHRDIKPGNIYLDTHDFVKLLDFGVAKVPTSSDVLPSDSLQGTQLTRVGQAVGTLEYMAPEQIIGGICDARSDIYALGVVAYEMIVGRRPFADATGATSLITALMTQSPMPPSLALPQGLVPPEVDELLLRCLERDMSDRFDDVRALAHAIDRVLNGGSARRAVRDLWTPEFDDEVTWIDAPAAPLVPMATTAAGAEVATVPQPVRAPVMLRRADTELPEFTVGVRGSTVDARALPCRWVAAKIAAWTVGLMAAGVGIGMAIASLLS
jgi:serine/threonine-protein kinase